MSSIIQVMLSHFIWASTETYRHYFSGVESETTKVNQNEAATHLFVSLADCYAIEMSTGTAIEK